jgi:hypothetical protein
MKLRLAISAVFLLVSSPLLSTAQTNDLVYYVTLVRTSMSASYAGMEVGARMTQRPWQAPQTRRLRVR